MKKSTLLALLLLTSCAAPWRPADPSHPPAASEQSDRSECARIAAHSAIGPFGGLGAIVGPAVLLGISDKEKKSFPEAYRACMRARGWKEAGT